MSDNEINLPTPGNNKRRTSDLLPRFFRTEANKKFLQATLDQLTQPGVAEKLSTYYGRKNAKAYHPSDNYISDVNADRENRQLEPAVVIKDNLDNVTFYKDYNDYVNQIKLFGGNVDDHSRLNTQQTYSWNPNIDWDKFVNFREYYWLPAGPLPVSITGQSKEIISTYTVTSVEDDDNVAYVFSPNGFTRNPTLRLFRGQTYRFEINCPGHPIAFSVSRSFTPGEAVIVAGTEGVIAPGLYGVSYDDLEFDTGDFFIVPSSEQYFSDNTFTALEAFIEAYKPVSLNDITSILSEKISVINFIKQKFINKNLNKDLFLELVFNNDLPKFIRTINRYKNDFGSDLIEDLVRNFNIDISISNIYNNTSYSFVDIGQVKEDTVNLQNYIGIDVDLQKTLNARNKAYVDIIDAYLIDFYLSVFNTTSQIGVKEYQNDINEFRIIPNSGSVTFNADQNVSTLFNDGVSKTSNEGDELAVVYVEKGVIEFTVPFNSPEKLYYISKNNIDTSGVIRIENIEENTVIDIEQEVIGKKYYTSSTGVEFTNGLKVSFRGEVTPEKYAKGNWYVEGVGDRIRLISEDKLKLPVNDTLSFDSQGFDENPYESVNQLSKSRDYLVINRASRDGNYWSRYNRWFHKSVLEKSFEYNDLPIEINETGRAKRPIIEFEAGLKLFEFGTEAKTDIDLIDTFTTDVFSTIEGSFGYIIDGIKLIDGMRILFTADPDVLVKGRIYQVKYIQLGNDRQITLIETDDSVPLENETVLVKNGDQNANKIYFYDGVSWKLAQEKTVSNQPPRFDLCCPQGNFFNNENAFDSSTFTGTKIFSYREGEGVADTELGFALEYKNIENSGDIVFDFNLLNDSFTIQTDSGIETVETKYGNLRKYTSRDEFDWVNGWSKLPQQTVQKVLRQYNAIATKLNNFEIDVYDRSGDLNDLKVYVYVNNQFKKRLTDYEIDRINGKAFVRFYRDLSIDDVVLIKTTSATPKNSNGWYDFPINLERNPLNQNIESFTLGEVIDHVNSMVEDLIEFEGIFPGRSNIRDLGEIDHYGKRFVKHVSPIPLSLYHITNKEHNIVKAIEYSKTEYAKFKRVLVDIITTLGYDGPVKGHLDVAIREFVRDKVQTQPFYFSDMIGFNETRKINYTVFDEGSSYYSLTEVFDITQLSESSVNVYLNGTQILYDRDYTFNDDGFLILNAGQKEGDTLEVYEYESTNGSFIPPTPTKLGLYPKYQPHLVIDDTYQNNVQIDYTKSYKIYGEVQESFEYENTRGWFYPVYTSKRSAQDSDPNGETIKLQFKGLGKNFYLPKSSAAIGKQDNPEYDEYPLGIPMIFGHDGSFVTAYKDYRDELLLEFEYRVFNNIKVTYNPDIFDINEFVGGKFRKTGFTKQEIDNSLLVDFVNWLSLIDADYSEHSFFRREEEFTFNYSMLTSAVDGQVLPGFWRGIYKELLDTDRPHSHPWEMLGFSIKPTWWNEVYGAAPYTRNNEILWKDLEQGLIREPNKSLRANQKYVRPGLTNNIPVDDQGKLLSPLNSGYAKNFFFRGADAAFKFGDEAPVETAWRRSSEYPFAILKAWLLNQPSKVIGTAFDISRVSRNLAGQIVYSDTLDQISTETVVLPSTYLEDNKIRTSGLVNYIYNLISSNVLKVYDNYRDDISNITVQMGMKIGGFTDKSKFKLLLDSKTPSQEVKQGVFVPEENYQVFLNTSSPVDIPVYSGVLIEKATDGFIIRGYNNIDPYFKYNPFIETKKDIVVTVGGISESSSEWRESTPYVRGQLLEYSSEYYRVVKSFTSSSSFSEENLARVKEVPIVGGRSATFRRTFDTREVRSMPYGTKLKTIQEVIDFILGYNSYLKDIGFEFNYFNNETGYVENWDYSAREFLFWTTQGWSNRSTIALSPAARELKFQRDYAIVDNIFDDFYGYLIKDDTNNTLDTNFGSVLRYDNDFSITTEATDKGLYNIRLPLVQKEHVVLLDNVTIFNDVIYQPKTGFRQERIKVVGYRSDNWNGGLNIPGFVYDDAKVETWEPWKKYDIGSLVKYKQFYYVAIFKDFGSQEFDATNWYRLSKKPESQLIANFDYKINQFADFYDLDSDNFDAEQQRMAQHLIGYQKRNYLSNLIIDDISQYKFYQGFISEKGTRNSLDKLFKTLTPSRKNSLEFYEEWALQLGRYGASETVKQIELNLNEEFFKESPQSIELVDSIPSDRYDTIYKIKISDVYDSPDNLTEDVFPTTKPRKDFLTGGYVNEEDINLKLIASSDYALINVNDYNFGDYIWKINDVNKVWDVLQFKKSKANAISIDDTNTSSEDGRLIFDITVDRWASTIFEAGDYIGFKNLSGADLNGLYEVESVSTNVVKVLVPQSTTSSAVNNINSIIVTLRSVRTATIEDANQIVQQDLYENQRFWIDSYSDIDQWAMIENSPVYSENQTIFNPEDFDSTEQNFADSMSATADNLKLLVSAPRNLYNGQIDVSDNKGLIYHYSRPNNGANLLLTQTITTEEVDATIETYRSFGESISVSEDGIYLAVGIPTASNVKTRFKDFYNSSTRYTKGDIVKNKDRLWKAVRDIDPVEISVEYNEFNTYENLIEQDSTLVNLLVTGDLGIPNSNVDHMLVRAPSDQYKVSSAGDFIKLKWNVRSVNNETLENVYPWDDENFVDILTQEHEILNKIDRVFTVADILSLPSIGNIIYSNSGSAVVQYVKSINNNSTAVIYVNNVKGDFSLTGRLYDSNSIQICSYSEELTYNISQNFNGFWMIGTPAYNNSPNYVDPGKGLVYVDLRTQVQSSRDFGQYSNIQDNILDLGENNNASLIAHLSYANQASNLWVVRADNTTIETPFRLVFNDYDHFDFSNTGFTKEIIDGTYSPVDTWDGFINFVLDDVATLVEVGDILSDAQIIGSSSGTVENTSQAEVKYVQRIGNDVKVYIKAVTGDWGILANLYSYRITKNGSEIGTVITPTNDLFFAANSLIVLENDFDFPVDQNTPIVDREYYFYHASRTDYSPVIVNNDINLPSTLNRDYQEVFNIPSDPFGYSGYVNQGAVALYELRNNSYILNKIITSDIPADNKRFGNKVKIIKNKDSYTLFVHSLGDQDTVNSSIEVYSNGYLELDNFKREWNSSKTYNKGDIVRNINEYYQALVTVTPNINILTDQYIWKNITWARKKDEKFTGEWSITNSYKTNEIVIYNNSLYKANTNINTNTVFDNIRWSLIESSVEYSSIIPTTSILANNSYNYIKNFDVSQDGSVLALVTGTNGNLKLDVSVYRKLENLYDLTEILTQDKDNFESFGSSFSIRPDGGKIAVGEPKNDDIRYDQGKVFVYSATDTQFSNEYVTLTSPNDEEAEQFGYSLSYARDNLAITSLAGDMTIPTTFDIDNEISTTFDRGFTQFKNTKINSGVIYLYEDINDQLIFSEYFRYDSARSMFGEVIESTNSHIYVGMPKQVQEGKDGIIVDYRKTRGTLAWNTVREIVPPVDVKKIQGAFLYNKRTNQIVEYLDFIDPVQGKIAGPAEQNISFKTEYDPATYNFGGEQNTTYWSDEHVGKLWWNTSTAEFKYPYTGNVNYQKGIWNDLQDSSSVDVYEWVESSVLPSEWDRISQLPDNFEKGISGTSLYGDQQYTVKFVYDSIAKNFSRKYYFWVRDSRIIPSINGRTLNTFDVANFIARPRQNGYKFISFIGNNKFILNNCNSLITDQDIVLNIRYVTEEIKDQNTHSQYQILTDGLSTSLPHPDIERKWFDSLIGFDEQTRPVPDMNLTVKNRYGVQNRPRQSMFVNRIEALKQYFERVNLILKENIIVDEYDISNLERTDPVPSVVTNLYDNAVASYEELQFVSKNKLIPAILEPVVVNGKIVSVNIVNPGRGYKTPPSYIINGTGESADFSITINNLGQIVKVDVKNQGKFYDETTNIVVRNFSVLVQNDETTSGKWSIYQWERNLKEWQRTSVQDFNVREYWDYVDWYATGINSNTVPNYIIEGSYDIDSIDPMIGDIVKIKNIGTGGWLLLRKVDNQPVDDYSVNYETIGRQNGTLQFKDTLYDYDKNPVAFNNSGYSSTIYDSVPSTELRIIFNTIKHDIFTKSLKVEYNKLFVAALRYVMSEQHYVDWMFKTSFVKIKHNYGELEQDITFNNDNLENYQDYINEIKPYKTTVREFVSAYESIDNTNSNISDFDLSPYWNKLQKKLTPSEATIENGVLVSPESNLYEYPRLNWTENYGHTVKEIKILDGGSGYLTKPTVTIQGGYGEGATAEAFLGYGKITSIRVTTPGKNYLRAPAVVIEGPQSDTGTPAKVSAVLDKSVVRTPSVKVKFDRISGRRSAFITELEQTETFVGTNVSRVFDLEWPADLRPETINVTVAGKEILRSQYQIQNIENTNTGYTRHQGRIIFDVIPALNSSIVVSYQKPLSMLDAEDRIRYGYKPTSGMLDNDISQLMTGIDYGGVEIRGLDFGKEEGWDVGEWYDDDVWDNVSYTTQDLIFKFDGSTIAIDLEEPLERNVEYNVYLNGDRIDDPAYDGSTLGTESNPSAQILPIIGDGVTQILDLDELGIKVADGDVLIVRKSTSDGSDIIDPTVYDTALSGGNMSYSTATGIAAEDIVVDGDGFVTTMTSGGPEELVPGQVMDTLDIQVYTRRSGGIGLIHSQNHITASNTSTYSLDNFPANSDSIIVKIDNRILGQDEYTVDWENLTITLSQPQNNTRLSIVSTSLSSNQIIDYGLIVLDGSTSIYELDVLYDENILAYVTIDGTPSDVTLTESVNGKLTMQFNSTQIEQGNVNYTLFVGDETVNYSQISKETFVVTETTDTFVLEQAPFYTAPTAHKVIIKVNDKILDAGYNIKHVIPSNNTRVYPIERFQNNKNTVLQSDIHVYLNGVRIESPSQWYYNLSNQSVILKSTVGIPGDEIRIVVFKDGEYQLENNVLTLDNAVDAGDTVEIYKFSNHDIIGMERISYDVVNRDVITPGTQEYVTYHRLTYGEIKLKSPVESAQYAWVILNGKLLSPNVDYFITDDGSKVRLAQYPSKDDVYEVIYFSSSISRLEYRYRQFKDILNRTHFKRIDDSETVLAKDLNWFDPRIEVIDASNLSEPNTARNKPGIIFVGKERIEYFVKDGNILRQIRRGTLGTGIKEVHSAGTEVFDQSSSKTIPYKDITSTYNLTGTGLANVFELNFTADSKDEFDVFVAGRRLNKNAITVFDPAVALDSTKGDIIVPAEFDFDPETNQVSLLATPEENQKIVIVKKNGRNWSEDLLERYFKK